MPGIIKRVVRRVARKMLSLTQESVAAQELPLHGYEKNRMDIKGVDYLGDEDLKELNNILPWRAFVVDSNGRRVGNYAWTGKRSDPQPIPDRRHQLLQDRISLKDRSVLEIGCFEGIHTISLCRLAKTVVAIDSRIENVVKTIVRTSLFGYNPSVLKCDVEIWDAPIEALKADVCHHIGVLYHLKDPVQHLVKLSSFINDALLLDTHIAVPGDQLATYQSGGKDYAYRFYGEGGKTDVFSGMYDHSKWLLLDDLKSVLTSCGFKTIEVLEERAERNGPRILLFAKK